MKHINDNTYEILSSEIRRRMENNERDFTAIEVDGYYYDFDVFYTTGRESEEDDMGYIVGVYTKLNLVSADLVGVFDENGERVETDFDENNLTVL